MMSKQLAWLVVNYSSIMLCSNVLMIATYWGVLSMVVHCSVHTRPQMNIGLFGEYSVI